MSELLKVIRWRAIAVGLCITGMLTAIAVRRAHKSNEPAREGLTLGVGKLYLVPASDGRQRSVRS
jgi:hypothetical protein